MLNISVVSFYDNFCLIFKSLEHVASRGIENWPLLTPLRSRTLTDIRISIISPETAKVFVADTMSILITFHIIVSENEAKQLSQTDDGNTF